MLCKRRITAGEDVANSIKALNHEGTKEDFFLSGEAQTSSEKLCVCVVQGF